MEEPRCYNLSPLGSKKKSSVINMVKLFHHHGTPSSASEANSTNCPAHLGRYLIPKIIATPRGDWRKLTFWRGDTTILRPRSWFQEFTVWCGKTESQKWWTSDFLNPNFKVKSNMPRHCKSEKCQKVQDEIAKPCETIFRQLSKAE